MQKENYYFSSNTGHILILLFLSFVWGSSFILIKKGLIAFSSSQVGTLRVGFTFIILLPFAIKRIKSVFRAKWKIILIYGTIANLVPAILFAVAETGLSSSLAGVLNSLTPIFTLLVGIMFFAIPIHKTQTIGLAIGFAGSVLISMVGASGGLGEFNFYVIFVLLATLCYGFAGNMVRRYFMEIDSITLTSLAFFSIGPFAILYLLSSDFLFRMSSLDTAWSSLFYIFVLAAIGTALAMVIFNKLIQATSAVFASTVTYIIPIAAVIWGLIDGETLFPLHFVGMLLIVAGVFVVNKYKKKST